jgi:hypothetical protein
MIIDILFTVGSAGFLMADVKQLYKLMTSEHATTAMSRTHFKLKLFSLACVSTGYYLSSLHMSLTVSASQFILNVLILYYVITRYEK